MSIPAYPTYKDSRVEWLGEVPTDWVVSKLGYFFREPPCYGVLVPDFDPDGVPMLRITDMEHEFIDTSGLVTISTELSSQYSRTIVKEGDIVLSLVGTIGKAFEIGPKLVGVNLSRAIARIQLDSNTLPRYLCWIFQSRAFTHFIDLVCRGTAQRVLNLSDLNAFSFVFPTNVEQFAISAFLDHETARIDVLIEEQQRLIELLKEKRQAVISHAVTKGLDSTAPMKDSGVEWLGEVPAHWEIGGLTRFIGPVVDYRGRTPTKVDDGVFLVTARNIRNGRIDYEASEEYADPESAESLLARGRPEIGDLLFTMEAPLGQVALIDRTDIALAQRIVKFRGEPSIMRNHYLMFWLMSKTCQARLETLATGSTALGIKSSKLGMIECLAPTLNEQDAIVSHIQRESEQNDALVYEAANVIGLLQERRSALISAAVTGKIDVRGWQPPVGASSPELAQEAV